MTDIFCHLDRAIVCPFTPLTIWKIKILKKWKTKHPKDIISLHLCTRNDNHIEIWSTTDRFFVILDHFVYPFTSPCSPLTTQKIKIKKKWNKYLKISPLYTSEPQITIIWCMVPEIWSMVNIYIFSFWTIFSLLAP